MKKVAVIMGSSSDFPTMKPSASSLRKKKVKADTRVISAHRTPDKMASFAKAAHKKGYGVIIAGAGGAAHLPGMTASHTLLPVIGIPVKSKTFSGSDSLLSILQMPPGVSVLTVGVAQATEAGKQAHLLLQSYAGVNLIGQTKSKPAQECKSTLESFGIESTMSSKAKKGMVNIAFVSSPQKVVSSGCVIHCLVTSKLGRAQLGVKLTNDIKKGLWVGVNNGVNAALSSVQILNVKGKHQKALQSFRNAQKSKAEQMDKDVSRA